MVEQRKDPGLVARRPAETGAAGTATLVNGVFLILTGLGVDVSPEVVAGVNIVVGFAAAAITRWIARREV